MSNGLPVYSSAYKVLNRRPRASTIPGGEESVSRSDTCWELKMAEWMRGQRMLTKQKSSQMDYRYIPLPIRC